MITKGFIRIKKINGKNYAYYVVNRWYKKKGPRQKVIGYLGKVIKLEKVIERDFLDGKDLPNYIKDKNKDTILIDLIKHELTLLGFDEKDNCLRMGFIEFDPLKMELWQYNMDRKKNIVIEMNEGFMCNKTLNNLFKFKALHDRNPYFLAKAFLESGLKVPEELFVNIYDKFV